MQKGIFNRDGDTRPTRRRWRHVLAAGLTRASRSRAVGYLHAMFVRLTVVNSGAVAAEYAFLIVFIAIVAAVGMFLLGNDLQEYFQGLATALDNAASPTPDPFAT